jgi:hypothetical protein
VSAQPVERDRPADTAAGLLAAVAIVAALLSLAYRPVRLDPFAIVVALIAAGIGGRHQRLAAVAVATASACFILGMVIAILTEKPLF